MSRHSPINDEYPTPIRRIRNRLLRNLGLDLHVERLLHHSWAPTIKRMPIVRDITASVYKVFGSSQGMEQG